MPAIWLSSVRKFPLVDDKTLAACSGLRGTKKFYKMHCGNINRCVCIRIALDKYKKSRNRWEHEKCCLQDRQLSGCFLKPCTPDGRVLSILMIAYNLSCSTLNSTSQTLSFDSLHVPYGYYSR